MMTLPKIRTGLRFNRLDNQVLVYDPRADAVHLLDPTTTLVADLLRNGTDVLEIETELGRRSYGESSEDLIGLALDELRKADLLDESGASIPPLPEVSRRELLRKVALTGAAALLVPAIVTLSPSLAYAQGSCGVHHVTCCTSGAQCCEGVCSHKVNTSVCASGNNCGP